MYKIIVDLERTVFEKYEVTLQDSHDPETALDHVYEHFSTYPHSELEVKSRRKIQEDTVDVKVVSVEHEREGLVQDDQRDTVFQDD